MNHVLLDGIILLVQFDLIQNQFVPVLDHILFCYNAWMCGRKLKSCKPYARTYRGKHGGSLQSRHPHTVGEKKFLNIFDLGPSAIIILRKSSSCEV